MRCGAGNPWRIAATLGAKAMTPTYCAVGVWLLKRASEIDLDDPELGLVETRV